jgi:hypothetical protein
MVVLRCCAGVKRYRCSQLACFRSSLVTHVTVPGLELSRDLINRFTRHIVQLDVSEHGKQNWIRHISRGHGEALAALLLARLPKMEKLDICMFDIDPNMKHSFLQILPQRKPFWTLMMPKPTRSLFQKPFLRNAHTLNLLYLRCSACDMGAAFALPSLHGYN